MSEVPQFMTEEQLSDRVTELRRSSKISSYVARGCFILTGVGLGWLAAQTVSGELDTADVIVGVMSAGPAVVSYKQGAVSSKLANEAMTLQLESTYIKFVKDS